MPFNDAGKTTVKMKPTDLINRSALLKKLREDLEDYTSDHFATDSETGVSEGGAACEEYRKYLEETIEAIELFSPISTWKDRVPDEIGLWWWWNEDEDSAPIVVDIAYSGTGDEYFAMAGQHGWTRFQNVTEMGGLWMRLNEPDVPDESK